MSGQQQGGQGQQQQGQGQTGQGQQNGRGQESDTGHGSQQGTGQQNGDQQGAQGTQQGQGQQNGQGSQQGQQGQDGGAWRIEDLPEGARRYITDLRDEAAGHRTGRNSAEQELTQLRGAVQGLTGQDGQQNGQQGGQQSSTDDLARQLQAERDRTRERDVELAVMRSATQHNADPLALLDSRAFLDRVRTLDPSAPTFLATVGQEIQQAVTANPRLAADATGQQTQQQAPGGRQMGQGRPGQQTGLTGVAAGRALRQERRTRTRDRDRNTT